MVMRITDMITQGEFAWYFINFSPLTFVGNEKGKNENSNFDLRVLKVKNLIGGEISYESLLGERIKLRLVKEKT